MLRLLVDTIRSEARR